MRSGKLTTILANAVAGLAVIACACDSVRHGAFYGQFPGAMRVAVPRTPELIAAAAGHNPIMPARVRTWQYFANRTWSYQGPEVGGGGVIDNGVLPTTVDAYPWFGLAGSLDQHMMTSSLPPILSAGIVEVGIWADNGPSSANDPVPVAVDANHVLFVSLDSADVQPLGPGGPTVHVTPGFHEYERTCGGDGQPSFVEVALGTPLQAVPAGWEETGSTSLPLDPFPASCGIDTAAPIDLGTVAAPLPRDGGLQTIAISPLPARLGPQPLLVESLAWAPGAGGLYFLAKQRDKSPAPPMLPQIGHLTPGEAVTTVVLSDDVQPPLAVATGGSSLLLSLQRSGDRQYVRQALSGLLSPFQGLLTGGVPGYPMVPPAGPFDSVLSPDGNILAAPGPTFVDLRTMAGATLALPGYAYSDGYSVVPRAWAPDGSNVLMEVSRGGSTPLAYIVCAIPSTDSLPTSVTGLTPLPLPDPAAPPISPHGRYFWSASGPQVLMQDAGAYVYNFATAQSSLFVEADRVAPWNAPVDVSVATDQAFAWAMQCFGLGETSCRAELRRLSLATGAVAVVATADQPRIFAVSPDGKQIAFADDDNLYLKPLAPSGP